MKNYVINKFIYAGRGLIYAWRYELSFRLEVTATIFIILVGWLKHWPVVYWLVLVLTITLVLVAELINTVLEKLCDMVEPRLSVKVRLLKDVMAAVVGLTALAALTVGLILWYSI